MVSRRNLIGALGVGFALSGLARPAGAFRIEEASPELRTLRFSACGGASDDGSEHDKIRAEIVRLLGEPQLPAAERDRLTRGISCRLCGGLVGPGC